MFHSACRAGPVRKDKVRQSGPVTGFPQCRPLSAMSQFEIWRGWYLPTIGAIVAACGASLSTIVQPRPVGRLVPANGPPQTSSVPSYGYQTPQTLGPACIAGACIPRTLQATKPGYGRPNPCLRPQRSEATRRGDRSRRAGREALSAEQRKAIARKAAALPTAESISLLCLYPLRPFPWSGEPSCH